MNPFKAPRENKDKNWLHIIHGNTSNVVLVPLSALLQRDAQGFGEIRATAEMRIVFDLLVGDGDPLTTVSMTCLKATRVPGMCAGGHACGFVLAWLKSNCLADVHSALRVREQDLSPMFPATPIVPTLDLDKLIGLQDGARKESIAGQ